MGYALRVIERDDRAREAQEEMVRAGLVVPVEIDTEARLWLDCDLAVLAENRLGDRTDPHELDKDRRADWKKRATSERASRLGARSKYETCHWLLEDGERVGTIAIWNSTLGSPVARLSSFYVFPAKRSRGVGGRALARMREIFARHRLGIRLETSWSWQRTVRFYQRAGMWVYMWKRDLALGAFHDTPPPHIEVGEREAHLSVRVDGEEIVLQRARRRGDVLELDDPPRELEDDERLGRAWWEASSTLSLALALEGWPLVRSPEMWERMHYADAGPPEALAYKIEIWEAWDRHHGWIVDTPRIPGLAYPTWEALQAKWDEENAEIEAKMKRGEPL